MQVLVCLRCISMACDGGSPMGFPLPAVSSSSQCCGRFAPLLALVSHSQNPIQLKCLVKDSIIFQPGPKPPVPGKGPSQLAISSTPMFYPKVCRRITGAESEDGTPPCQLSLHSSLVDFVESPQLPAPSWLFHRLQAVGNTGMLPRGLMRWNPASKGAKYPQFEAMWVPWRGDAWGCVG